jgi:phosphatidylglycerophosphate synthase
MSKQLFLLGCIPTRILIAYLAFYFSENRNVSNIFAILALLISIGFFYIYFTGSRKTGTETEGREIWWNNWRPVHGSIYLLFCLLTLSGVKNAWVVLALDVMIGLVAFTKHYYSS